MTKTLFTTFLLAFISCNPVTETQFKTNASAVAGNKAPSKWPSSAFPLKIKISDDFASDEISAIEDMSDAWNDSVDHQITFMEQAGSTSAKSNNLDAYSDSTIGVYKIYSWPKALPGSALAVTQIFGTRKNIGRSNEYIRIDHADILMNFENFTFVTDGSWGYDFRTIVLHEMGHLIGLYHDDSSIDDSVMFPSITRFVYNQYPMQRDINNLKDKYGLSLSSNNHVHSFRSPASTQEDESNTDNEEKVIIQFEIMADGKEITKVLKR